MNKNNGSGNTHPVVIDGKEFDWEPQFITGNELRKLGGLPADARLYLKVAEPWDDEPVEAETKVDLGRPEIEEFIVRKNLSITINGKPFDWEHQYITGKQVRKIGNIGEDEDLFLDIDAPDKDQRVDVDTKINLARGGTEHFVTKQEQKVVILIIDGTPKKWDKRTISFKEVIILAFGEYIDKETMVYTVAFEDGPKQNPEGSMHRGSTVIVKDKMIFHATATDKS